MKDGRPSDAAPEGGGLDSNAEGQVPGEPLEYCPVCSARLEPRKCKLICARCGYYMSCSDYY